MYFPAVWPRDSAHIWESLYDGQSPSTKRITKLLERYIEAEEVIVLLHADRGIGAVLNRDAAVDFIIDHFAEADIQVSDKQLTSFVEISRIGVGTGWRVHTH